MPNGKQPSSPNDIPQGEYAQVTGASGGIESAVVLFLVRTPALVEQLLWPSIRNS